ncbi:MAG: hypothetical protein SO016_11880 [Lachnospiraceae bacterium]|nr:hypothetical protein [Robinsoniella sp.]MDY3767366.1 hypothetical protein [Lachnospiraceae bacterium]
MKNSEKKRIRKQILSAGISAAMFAGMIGSISVVAGETTASDSAVKYQITDSGYGFQVVTQIDGATLSYSESSGVILLEQDGYAFKDLNRNGVLDTYEDWREDDETRAQALASLLMSDGEEGLHTALGLLYHPSARMESTATEESALYDYVVNQKIRHILSYYMEGNNPTSIATANNAGQSIAESQAYGIPINYSSDPRHGASGEQQI